MDAKALEWKIGGKLAIHIVHESHSTDVITTGGKKLTLEESGCQNLNSMIGVIILCGKTVRHHMLPDAL